MALFPSYPGSDDAFIHLRIADLLASGSGWGINPGQWINMSTSPLFTLLVAGGDRLGLPPIGAAQVLSALAASGGLACCYLSARRLSASLGAALAITALAAINTQLWRWTGTVMETTLGFAAVAGLLHLDLRWPATRRTVRQWGALGVLTGLAVLVRFELLLLLALLVLVGIHQARTRTAWRGAVVCGGGAAAVLVPYVVFAAARLDRVLPTTFSAKAGGWQFPGLDVVRPVATTFLSAQPILIVLAAVGVVLALRARDERAREERARAAVAALFVLGWLGFYLLRFDGLESAGRLLVPVMAAVVFVAAATIDRVVASATGLLARVRALGTLARPATLAVGALTVQLVVLGAFTAVTIVPVLRDYDDGYRATMTATAAALGEQCNPDTRVLVVVDIGTLAYEDHGDCRIVDGGGLADPDLAGRSVRDQIARSRPDLVVETLGSRPGSLRQRVGCLELQSSRRFPSHSVAHADRTYVRNVYTVPPGCPA